MLLKYGPSKSEFEGEIHPSLFSHFKYPNPKYDVNSAIACDAEGQEYVEPEFYSYVSQDEDSVTVPTGLYWAVKKWARLEDVDLQLVGFPDWFEEEPLDNQDVIDPDIIEGITLRDYQEAACNEAILRRRGVLEIATGGGKSEMCIALTLHFGEKTLCVTPDQAAMANLYERFSGRNLQGMTVGRLGDGYRDLDCDIVVAVINSLHSGLKRKDTEIQELLEEAEVFFSDEAHHQKASSWIRVAMASQAHYRFFLSGTPYKNDDARDYPENLYGEDSWIVGLSGRSIYYLAPKHLIAKGVLSAGMFVSFPVGGHLSPKIRFWPKVAQMGIVENIDRNTRICNLVSNLTMLGRYPLVSIEKLDHGRALQKTLWRQHKVPTVCSFGSGVLYVPREVAMAVGADFEDSPLYETKTVMKRGKRKKEKVEVGKDPDFVKIDPKEVNAIDWLRDGVVRSLIGSRIFDEAQNIPFLTDLINASGGKASQRLRQKIGRVLRKSSGKTMAWFWDPWDTSHYFLLNHSKARKKIAQEEGYPVIDDPLFSLPFCSGDLSQYTIGDTTVREKEIEVSVGLTIPLSQSGGNYYVKPTINLRAVLDEGDDPEKCSEILHHKAVAMFVREAYRQAALAGAIGQHGFDAAREHFVAQAQKFLEENA